MGKNNKVLNIVKDEDEVVVFDGEDTYKLRNTASVEKIIQINKIVSDCYTNSCNKEKYIKNLKIDLERISEKIKKDKHLCVSGILSFGISFAMGFDTCIALCSGLGLVISGLYSYFEDKGTYNGIYDEYKDSLKLKTLNARIAEEGISKVEEVKKDDIDVYNIGLEVSKIDMKNEYKRIKSLILEYENKNITQTELLNLIYDRDFYSCKKDDLENIDNVVVQKRIKF